MSGQYMTHGLIGSSEMLRTRPPLARAWPLGVKRGYDGAGGLDGASSGCSCAAGEALREEAIEGGKGELRDRGGGGGVDELPVPRTLCMRVEMGIA